MNNTNNESSLFDTAVAANQILSETKEYVTEISNIRIKEFAKIDGSDDLEKQVNKLIDDLADGWRDLEKQVGSFRAPGLKVAFYNEIKARLGFDKLR